jgi:DNA-binding transcriptional LysR family regulator
MADPVTQQGPFQAIRAGATVDDLRAFVAVARLGTVSRAAEALGRTQPSVSARLATLEALWDVRLFDRRPRGMVVTTVGEGLLPLARKTLSAMESLERAAGHLPDRRAELRIGAGDALGRVLAPRAIGKLLKEYPETGVRILEGNSARLLEALGRGDIDLALVASPGIGRQAAGLTVEPLLDSPVDLLAPAGSRWKGRDRIGLDRLAGERLVTLHSGSGFRRHIEERFAAAGLPFEPEVEVGGFSLVRRYVTAGLGVAPVPAVAFEIRSRGRGSVRLRMDGIPPISYHRAVRAGDTLPAPTARFLEIMTEMAS